MLNGAVIAALSVLCAIAWLYLLRLDTGMSNMPTTRGWGTGDAAAMFAMWAIMMVAMMLPSVTQMVLLYARTLRHRAAEGGMAGSVALFVSGYLMAWVGFSALATYFNWLLHQGDLMNSMMGRANLFVAGSLLITAGIYQLTPFKDACLRRCRSPFSFLADHWRDGRFGAAIMGLHHGMYCVGCCWLLMALLFVLGVMNLAWIAVLTIFVLVEKYVSGPVGIWLSAAAGAGFIIWGSSLILGA